jgi:flagellar biosynthesis/type III secretory pathway chaperone
MLKPLINTLEELIAIQEQLVKVSLKKKDIVIANDIEQLSQQMAEESKLVRKMGKLEEERMFQVKDYVRRQGITADEMTLSQLLSIIPSKEGKEEIQSLADKLQKTMAQLQQHNDLNSKLIQDSLDYINHSLEMMTDNSGEGINYQRPAGSAKKNPSTGRSFFDTKA